MGFYKDLGVEKTAKTHCLNAHSNIQVWYVCLFNKSPVLMKIYLPQMITVSIESCQKGCKKELIQVFYTVVTSNFKSEVLHFILIFLNALTCDQSHVQW